MNFQISRYHDALHKLSAYPNELAEKDKRTYYEQKELDRRRAEIDAIDNMNVGIEHEFISNFDEAIAYIHSTLDHISDSQSDRRKLFELRQESNKKLLHSPLLVFKQILQTAWYEAIARFDDTIHEICVGFIGKLRSEFTRTIPANYDLFDFYYTPFHPDFKYYLGQYILQKKGRSLDPEDYLFLYSRKLTNFGNNNLAIILRHIREDLDAFVIDNGLELMEWHLNRYKVDDFKRMKKLKDHIHRLTRNAENRARSQANLPNIGEGWIGETQLYNEIKQAIGEKEVIQHGSPKFLGRQHFDIWIPKKSVAIEYQGEQHFKPIDFFGGKDAYEITRRRDEKKKALCEENGVSLIYVREGYDIADVISRINRRPTT